MSFEPIIPDRPDERPWVVHIRVEAQRLHPVQEKLLVALRCVAKSSGGFSHASEVRFAGSSRQAASLSLSWEGQSYAEVWLETPATRNLLRELLDDPSSQIFIEKGVVEASEPPAVAMGSTPPKWKMTIVTWLAIFPTLSVFILGSVQALGDMPLIWRLLINTALIAPLMSWVIMPLMMRLFRNWLFPQPAL